MMEISESKKSLFGTLYILSAILGFLFYRISITNRILLVIGLVLISIGFFVDKSVISIVGCGVCTVCCLLFGGYTDLDLVGYYLEYLDLLDGEDFIILFSNVLDIAGWILLALSIKDRSKRKVYCFIILGTQVISIIIDVIVWGTPFISYLGRFVFITSTILLGVSATEKTDDVSIKKELDKVTPERDVGNQFEQLNKLKELLDRDIITKQEFDEKKKQILDL